MYGPKNMEIIFDFLLFKKLKLNNDIANNKKVIEIILFENHSV